jgi:hypothetical protein
MSLIYNSFKEKIKQEENKKAEKLSATETLSFKYQKAMGLSQSDIDRAQNLNLTWYTKNYTITILMSPNYNWKPKLTVIPVPETTEEVNEIITELKEAQGTK